MNDVNDVEALTELPREKVSCARLDQDSVDLRTASWSFQRPLCVEAKSACPSCDSCSRVAQALNRPLVSQSKVAA